MPRTCPLDEQEVLLGSKDVIAWGILREDLNRISGREVTRRVGKMEADSCYNSDEDEDVE